MARTRKNLIGPLRKGELTELGYSAAKKTRSRHASLKKAVSRYGRLSTYRKLNAVAVLTRRKVPVKSKLYIRDRNWVKKTYF